MQRVQLLTLRSIARVRKATTAAAITTTLTVRCIFLYPENFFYVGMNTGSWRRSERGFQKSTQMLQSATGICQLAGAPFNCAGGHDK
jgi:hypothetical protein